MARGLSLANKCQLLFGGAVVLIVTTALVLPWFRLLAIIDQSQFEASRQIARLWADSPWVERNIGWYLEPTDATPTPDPGPVAPPSGETDEPADPSNEPQEAQPKLAAATDDQKPPPLVIGWWPMPSWGEAEFESGFLQAARAELAKPPKEGQPPRREYGDALWDDARGRVYRLAYIHTEEGEPQGVLVVERASLVAAGQVFVNRMYLIIAGLLAGSTAVLVFWYITTRLILGPVRSLRDTAEMVKSGNLHIRSDIRTGDEFEQLAEAFNAMLAGLTDQQKQLRQAYKTLDLKLNEVAERNVELYEAARLKGEFVASVSHELRTPLNSIIGFAEILQEIAHREQGEPERLDEATLAKRRRYLDNIVGAGRSLLEMINELLTMAKIDAGRVEMHVQPINVVETCEGLIALIRPLADRKQIDLRLELQSGDGRMVEEPSLARLPIVETDPKKLEQIVFNFLANAVKFTPDEGVVTLRAEQLRPATGEAGPVRISVSDTGPGIPPDQHEAVFHRFRQIEGGHTRPQAGTGLGLAIAREFAQMLGAEITLISEPGAGAMFSLTVPLEVDPTLLEPQRPGQLIPPTLDASN